ncbi:MAG: TatD family hydrolase [Vicinamibacteria bacterium]|nr:TatD family hydrolase [Vicinamibacteria bacterium]
MIDTHCHLADEVFEVDLDAVVGRARAAGLTSTICILAAGDQAETRRAERVRQLWPEAAFAVGVHPHQAHQCAGQAGRAESWIRQGVSEGRVCAVGEIGLDYHYDFSPRDVQQTVFAEQLHCARAMHLPVVIHTREADQDAFAMLVTEGAGVAGVFHCFTGGIARARRALDLGFHLSLAGIVTFPKAIELHEVAAFVPEDRLLIETDSPFLAPVPYRGKRNEPAWVVNVADRLATLRGVPRSAVLARTTENALQLFGAQAFARVDTPRASML